MLYRRKDGIEQAAQPGTQLAETLEADPDWTASSEPVPSSPMPSLDRMTRKEIDALAEEAGVDNPKRLPSKAKVIEAIRTVQAK